MSVWHFGSRLGPSWSGYLYLLLHSPDWQTFQCVPSGSHDSSTKYSIYQQQKVTPLRKHETTCSLHLVILVFTTNRWTVWHTPCLLSPCCPPHLLGPFPCHFVIQTVHLACPLWTSNPLIWNFHLFREGYRDGDPLLLAFLQWLNRWIFSCTVTYGPL